MPNLDLQKKQFSVDDATVKQFLNGNDMISYEYMKKIKSELDNKSENDSVDSKVLKWIDKKLNTSKDKIDGVKRTIMNSEGQGKKKGGNAYKNTHEKDRDNANPTSIGLPKIHKGSTSRQIMSNKTTYESIESEIDSVRYLIEYMNNNKLK